MQWLGLLVASLLPLSVVFYFRLVSVEFMVDKFLCDQLLRFSSVSIIPQPPILYSDAVGLKCSL
jgi:hypothetical protein